MSDLSTPERTLVEQFIAEHPGSPRAEVGRALLLIDEGQDRVVILQILKKVVDGWRSELNDPDEEETAFQRDLDQVLDKNAELYRRLAR